MSARHCCLHPHHRICTKHASIVSHNTKHITFAHVACRQHGAAGQRTSSLGASLRLSLQSPPHAQRRPRANLPAVPVCRAAPPFRGIQRSQRRHRPRPTARRPPPPDRPAAPQRGRQALPHPRGGPPTRGGAQHRPEGRHGAVHQQPPRAVYGGTGTGSRNGRRRKGHEGIGTRGGRHVVRAEQSNRACCHLTAGVWVSSIAATATVWWWSTPPAAHPRRPPKRCQPRDPAQTAPSTTRRLTSPTSALGPRSTTAPRLPHHPSSNLCQVCPVPSGCAVTKQHQHRPQCSPGGGAPTRPQSQGHQKVYQAAEQEKTQQGRRTPTRCVAAPHSHADTTAHSPPPCPPCSRVQQRRGHPRRAALPARGTGLHTGPPCRLLCPPRGPPRGLLHRRHPLGSPAPAGGAAAAQRGGLLWRPAPGGAAAAAVGGAAAAGGPQRGRARRRHGGAVPSRRAQRGGGVRAQCAGARGCGAPSRVRGLLCWHV